MSTKHDIISELSDLDELLDVSDSNAAIGSRTQRLVRLLEDDVHRVDAPVAALKAEAARDSAYQLAYTLVAKSAANVLDAYDALGRAAALSSSRLTPIFLKSHPNPGYRAAVIVIGCPCRSMGIGWPSPKPARRAIWVLASPTTSQIISCGSR